MFKKAHIATSNALDKLAFIKNICLNFRSFVNKAREQGASFGFKMMREDAGFRLNTIRNKAINAASGEYIILIDGDMVLESHFIKDHLDFAKHKVFLQGSRVILDKQTSEKAIRGGEE